MAKWVWFTDITETLCLSLVSNWDCKFMPLHLYFPDPYDERKFQSQISFVCPGNRETQWIFFLLCTCDCTVKNRQRAQILKSTAGYSQKSCTTIPWKKKSLFLHVTAEVAVITLGEDIFDTLTFLRIAVNGYSWKKNKSAVHL